MAIKFYKWRCKVADPMINKEGVASSRGLVAAENYSDAMARVFEYMCLGDDDTVFDIYLESWDTDILSMDKEVLKAVEEDHMF